MNQEPNNVESNVPQGIVYSAYPQRDYFAPWVLAGSAVLFAFGVILVAFTFVKSGDAHFLWSYLVTGILLILITPLGIIASRSSNFNLGIVFFWVYGAVLVATIILMSGNSGKFKDYMREQCNNDGFSRETKGCADIRMYYLITLHAFAMFYFTVGPTFLLVAAYFRFYSKYPLGKAAH